MWKTLLTISIIPLIIIGLRVLGGAVNSILPWDNLTIFFGIVQRFGNVFAFTWDVQTLWTLVGLSLLLELQYWFFRIYLFVSTYFLND